MEKISVYNGRAKDYHTVSIDSDVATQKKVHDVTTPTMFPPLR